MNQRGMGNMIYHGSTPVTEIVLHCSATRPDWMAGEDIEVKAKEIDRWHRDRMFAQIGYHWVIDRNGEVLRGRLEAEVGAHVKGHNTGTIGICLIGGHGASANDSFDDHFTPEQRKAVWHMIRSIAERTDIRRVTGHNQYANKGCPGFQVSAEFPWPPAFAEEPSLWQAVVGILKALFGGRK